MSNTSSPFTTQTATGRRIETDLRRSLIGLQVVLADLDPRAIPLPDVTAVFSLFAEVRRLAGNGETLMAGRVKDARQWAAEGHPSVEDWIAKQTGSTVGAAKDQVTTSERLDQLPTTAERMRAGDVSSEQAGIVADAATLNPAAEDDLLTTAQQDSTKNLKDQAARRKAEARGESANERAKRQHRERRASAWRGSDGTYNFRLEGPVAATAAFNARWEREIDRQYRAAQSTGRREGRDAYAFDAFIALTERGAADPSNGSRPAPRPSPKHLALIRVDLSALVRGTVDDGEICEVAGIGPISVSEARALLGDSILHLVSENGVDVQNITYLGRGPNAVQTLALLWTSQQCSVLGCHRTQTQNDHRIEFAQTKHTRLDELDPLCHFHHGLKTFEGWALVAGTGSRRMVGPDDPDHPGRSGSPVRPRPPDSPGRPHTAVAPDLAERAARAHIAARRLTPGSMPGGARAPDPPEQSSLFDTC